MAERRMFSRKIVQSSRFLRMPVSSRELYFQLGISADDDGIVEAWNVMKLTGSTEDDLRVLVSRGYVLILDNDDLIAYLTDWNTNNKIRKDRYQESIYSALRLKIPSLDTTNKPQVTTNGLPSDSQTSTNVKPSVEHLETQYSIGKYSVVKDSIVEGSVVQDSLVKNTTTKKNKPKKHIYGEFGHVLLTDREFELLLNDHGDEKTQRIIKTLDEAIEMKGYKYKSCYMAIKKWVLNAVEEEEKKYKNTKDDYKKFIDGWVDA